MDASSLPAPEILLQHGRALRRLGRGLLGDAHLAEDLAQETLVRWLERSPGALRSRESWLGVVFRNLGLGTLRRRGNAAERERGAARPEALPSAADEAAQAELLRSVVDAVLALEEPYRATILARYFRGLEAREVAAADGIPLATVRSREQRALGKLRERLDHAYGERGAWGAVLASSIELPGSGLSSLLASGAAKALAAVALLAIAFLGWRELAPRPVARPAVVATPAVAAVAQDPAGAPAAEPDAPIQRTALPVASTLRLAGHLVELPCAELLLPERPAAGLEIAVRVGNVAPFGPPGPGVIQTRVTTDELGRFELEVEDPGERPLGVAFQVGEGATYRALRHEATIPAGASALEDLELARVPHGVLHGVTVDREGRALSGVRVQFLGSNRRVLREAISDGSGVLRVENLGDHRDVTADAPGHVLLDHGEPERLELGGWGPLRVTLAPVASLRLTLLDSSGKPVARTPVFAAVAGAELSSRARDVRGSVPERRATTDEQGTALLEGIWADTRLEIALALGSQRFSSEARSGGTLLFDHEPGAGAPIVVRTGEALELEMRLVGLELAGTVLHSGGEPAAHPKVLVLDEGREPGSSNAVLAVAEGDDGGRFGISLWTTAIRGPLRIVATAGEPPELAGELKGLGYLGPDPTPEGTSAAVRVLPWDAAAAAQELTLVLEPLLALEGRVLDPSGNPVAWGFGGGSAIWVAPAGRAHYEGGALGPIEVRTGEDGVFKAASLPAGLYDIFVSRELASFYSFSSFVQRFPGIAAGSRNVELVLSDEGPEAGEVKVRLRLRGGRPAAFVFLCGKLFPREPEALARILAPHELRVTSLAGWPLGAHHDFTGIGGELDALGRWQYGFDGQRDVSELELPPMGPGWCVLGVQANGADGGHAFFPMASERLWFEPGEYTLDFELVPTTSARGRIRADGAAEFLAVELVDAQGRALPLRTRPGYGTPVRFLETNARGEFLLQDVPVGSFRLRAGILGELRAGRARAELALDLAAGENEPIELRF